MTYVTIPLHEHVSFRDNTSKPNHTHQHTNGLPVHSLDTILLPRIYKRIARGPFSLGLMQDQSRLAGKKVSSAYSGVDDLSIEGVVECQERCDAVL